MLAKNYYSMRDEFEELGDMELFSIIANRKNDWNSRRAFDVIYNKYVGEVKRISMHLLSKAGVSDIDGVSNTIVQETFVRVFNSASKYKEGEVAKFWIFQIAKNVFLDEINRCDRRLLLIEAYNDTDLGEEELEGIDVHQDPESFHPDKETFDLAWNKLKELEQDVLRAYLSLYNVDDENKRLPDYYKKMLCEIHNVKDPNYLSKVRIRALNKLYRNCDELITINKEK